MTRAVIQAGGKGTRLYPYTRVLPKPLMPIGEAPILEIVIRQLVNYGFPDITITVGHLADLIMAVLGDGSHLGARIEYAQEAKPLGTIGALSALGTIDEPLLVMNGDLLTDFDYRQFMNAHRSGKTQLSVGVYNKRIPVSLGVLELDEGHRAVGFREKPVLSFQCSMGIYAIGPKLVRLIPREAEFGFDDLMALCLNEKIAVRGHPFDGLWLDIGRPEDYADAAALFEVHRSRFLPHEEPSPVAEFESRLGNPTFAVLAI